MLVHFLATYYSHFAHTRIAPRTPPHWESYKFCRAVKTGTIKEAITFPWKNQEETITRDDNSRARLIYGMFIRQKIFDCGIRNPVLIPVPSKDGLCAANDFRSYQMIREALQGDGDLPIVPALRFTESMVPANHGGTRDLSALYHSLEVIGHVPKGDIVLVDDIMTTGASIKAARRRMDESKIKVSAVIVCGYTVHRSSMPPFGNHQIQLSVIDGPEQTSQHEWLWQQSCSRRVEA